MVTREILKETTTTENKNELCVYTEKGDKTNRKAEMQEFKFILSPFQIVCLKNFFSFGWLEYDFF